MVMTLSAGVRLGRLNESPSQEEGKFKQVRGAATGNHASMKALPKRKGNNPQQLLGRRRRLASMKPPPNRKENKRVHGGAPVGRRCLNESPAQKERKFHCPDSSWRVVSSPQ